MFVFCIQLTIYNVHVCQKTNPFTHFWTGEKWTNSDSYYSHFYSVFLCIFKFEFLLDKSSMIKYTHTHKHTKYNLQHPEFRIENSVTGSTVDKVQTKFVHSKYNPFHYKNNISSIQFHLHFWHWFELGIICLSFSKKKTKTHSVLNSLYNLQFWQIIKFSIHWIQNPGCA